jgi:hypothetical protein
MLDAALRGDDARFKPSAEDAVVPTVGDGKDHGDEDVRGVPPRRRTHPVAYVVLVVLLAFVLALAMDVRGPGGSYRYNNLQSAIQ